MIVKLLRPSLSEMHRVVTDYTRVDDANSNIKVFVRARPPEAETDQSDFLTTDGDDERKLIIKDPDPSNKRYGEVSFQFDRVFWTTTKQEDVFDSACRAQVDHVLNGYNSCCFAYGQTGSGKTYTMFGEGGEIRGVIPRSVEYLFSCLAKKTATSEVAMVCSFLEIYNDQIRDLGKAYLAAMGVENNVTAAMYEKTSDLFEKLAGKRGNPYFAPAFHKTGSAMAMTGEMRPGLKEVQDEYNTMNYEIREDNEGNVFVKDLSLVPVTTMDEVMSLIATGLRVRATHETKMNATSSRSHTVFTITVLQRDKLTGEAITGMLNLVDLAGSERLKKSESVGIRLKEALHINTSLTALGKVIMALDPSSENSHIPYRDSKLTRVLQNSLGGNSFTTVIATVHPVARYYEECLSSLQFANRCRNVRNNPRVNYVEDHEDKDRKIRKLMEEIGALRSKMTQLTGNELHGGARGPTASTAAPAGKLTSSALVSLLKRLGIAATIAPDGTLLVNGQKFGLDEIGLDGGSEFGSDGRGGGKEGGVSSTMVDKLQRTIKELKETNANYSAKSKERKSQMEEQGRQLQKMSVELVKLQTGMRHKEFECKTLAEDKVRSMEEMKVFLEGKYAADLQAMIQHNRELMNQHQADIDRIPASLTEYTKLYAKTEKEKHEFEAPLRAEFETTLKGIDQSRVAEQAHVRAQYDFWLQEKDMALSGFVDAFNAYRAKKSEQLRMAEREIVRLYDYFEQLEQVLENARKGKYYFRMRDPVTGTFPTGGNDSRPRTANGPGETQMDETTSQRGALMLPKGEVPDNPFKTVGVSALALTKKIVERYKERRERLRRLNAEAVEKSVHYARESARNNALAKDLQGNVRTFLSTKRSQRGESPPKTEMVNGIVFHAPGVPRPRSASAQAVKALPASPKLPPARPAATAQPRGILPATLNQHSVHSRSGDNILKRASSTAPGELQSRSHLEAGADSWEDSPSGSPSASPGKRTGRMAAMEQQLKEMAGEIARLKDSEQKAKKEAAEMGCAKTQQYIKKLEGETERLNKLVKDINAQLHSSKIAQQALQRKFGKGYDSTEEEIM